jgi:hypothetical protein
MKTFLAIVLFLMALAVVGYVEDPCTTEGLPAGCMESK